MPKIVSFGDSFIFGAEIPGNIDGSKAWPGLAAQALTVPFQCRAIRGCGNARILKQILDYFSTPVQEVTLAVVNWTWIARLDLMDREDAPDITLGPTCVPERIVADPDSQSATAALEFYGQYVDRYPNHSLWNTLMCISAASTFLARHEIPCIQTYMDPAIVRCNWYGSLLDFYQEYRLPGWPKAHTTEDFDRLPGWIRQEVQEKYDKGRVPIHINLMQNEIRSYLQNFEDLNFLEWSAQHGFEITDAPNLHPLLPAHQAAAEFWLSKYKEMLA